jgi:hypothetical protein
MRVSRATISAGDVGLADELDVFLEETDHRNS